MKRIFRNVFVLVILAAFAVLLCQKVTADLVYEPLVDSFYHEHRNECRLVDSDFTVTSADGVSGFKSPEDLTEVVHFPQGTFLYISWTYEAEDGTVYGVYEKLMEKDVPMLGNAMLPEQDRYACWVPMDALFENYSSVLFSEDYADEIESRHWEMTEDEAESLQGETVYLYRYPGADPFLSTEFDQEDFTGTRARFYEGVYEDPYGNTWGRAEGFYGLKNRNTCWIVLSDPTIPPEKFYEKGRMNPDKREWPADIRGTQNGRLSGSSFSRPLLFVLIGCGAAAILAAFVLILILGRKK